MQLTRSRRQTRTVFIGGVGIGGEHPISVQSMTNTDTRDVNATVAQIKQLEAAGCEIVRLAVPDETAATALNQIRQATKIPLVADIHFNYKLALMALESGVDALRLNPGNIPKPEQVRAVVEAAHQKRVPIRIGVNAGSINKEILRQFGGPTPKAMVASALGHVQILEDLNFEQIIVSLKSSDIAHTLEANRLFAKERDYPLHLGITEAGPLVLGTIKSSVGLTLLLGAGLGDTVRVSLTADPLKEVGTAFEILRALGLREYGPQIISCPTCGRTEIDIISIAEEVEQRIRPIKEPLKIAVMGCVVNGPGEAAGADFGLAGGKGQGLIFARGEMVKKVREEQLVEALLDTIFEHLQKKAPDS